MKKLFYLFLVFGLFACSSDSEDDGPCAIQPQITTLEVTNIEFHENSYYTAKATLNAEIENIPLGVDCETFSITNQGFVWGETIQPTTIDNVENANGQNISINLSNLAAGATYYVRAYLTNTLGTFYGNEVSFATPETPNPVYLDANGVTIKARDWANVGDSGVINGITYTIIDYDSFGTPTFSVWDIMQTPNFDVCTTRVTTMHQLFGNYTGEFNNIDLGSWDVTNVVQMNGMFKNAPEFNQDISSWDVSNVTDMNSMFRHASSFNQDISSWDVSNVVDMYTMFYQAISFDQDLTSWNANNVTECYIFNCFGEGDPVGNQMYNIQPNNTWTTIPNFSNCSFDCN